MTILQSVPKQLSWNLALADFVNLPKKKTKLTENLELLEKKRNQERIITHGKKGIVLPPGRCPFIN